MGKSEFDHKKPATKSKKRSRRKLKTTASIVFEEVNGSHNVLVAAWVRHTQAVNPNERYGVCKRLDSGAIARLGHTTSKAIVIDLDPHDPSDMFNTRVQAISDFLRKIQKSSDVTLIVPDSKFSHVVNANETVASEAIATWNKFCENRKIQVITSWDDSDHQADSYESLLDCAKAMSNFRKQAILAPGCHR